MSSVKDVVLGEFANLSYIDLPDKLMEKIHDGTDVTLKDLADSKIDYYLDREKSGEISYQEQIF